MCMRRSNEVNARVYAVGLTSVVCCSLPALFTPRRHTGEEKKCPAQNDEWQLITEYRSETSAKKARTKK